MADAVSSADRLAVIRRAANRCEYCLLHEDDSFQPHEVDHVISRKHGGTSSLGNLAYACAKCNSWKGTDIAGLAGDTGEVVPLFHPRRDAWNKHFQLLDGEIVPLTPRGRATVRVLKLNLEGRISERLLLALADRYPRE